MASTYSALKIELIATGEQSGTWGTTTNTNLGDAALGEAITGSADVAFSSADVTVTLTDTNATQTARNLRLNLTGTSGGARNLILGSGCQIEKLYLVNNGLADAVTVKNTTGTGIAVAAGKSMFVYNNGTNVVDAVTYATSLTLGSALPIASGGTGSTSTTFVNLASNVTGTLPVANGGTGITSLGTGVATFLGTPTSANLAAALTDETGTGANVFATSPTLVTPVLGTPSSGTLTSCTGLPLTTGITGTLPVANGGTGSTTITANSVMLGNGTSALSSNLVAPSTTGNILTSNGTTWTSAAPAGGGGLGGTTVFTASGTFTIPTGKTVVKVTVVGGGGGGSARYSSSAGGGGTAIKYLTGLTPGNTLTVSRGAGGTNVDGGAGGTGGTSSVSSGTQTITTISATGGSGGNYSGGGAAGGGSGGTGSNGDLNMTGGGGGAYEDEGGLNSVTAGGGDSFFAGVTYCPSRGANGPSGNPYGGGASGNSSSGGTNTGGNGVIVFEY